MRKSSRGMLSAGMALCLAGVSALNFAEPLEASDPVKKYEMEAVAERSEMDAAIFPRKYDLRDEGYVTPVKAQTPWGSCWAFGGIAAMESSILSSEGVTWEDTVEEGTLGQEGAGLDLSEKHLAWFAKYPVTKEVDESQAGEGMHPLDDEDEIRFSLANGGNIHLFTSLLSSGVGPVLEESFPYRGSSGITNYEYYSSEDYTLDKAREDFEQEEEMTVREFLDEKREDGTLAGYIEEKIAKGVLEDGVTADSITEDDILQMHRNEAIQGALMQEAYWDGDDWTIEDIGSDGTANRNLSAGYTLVNGNVLPELSIKQGGKWTGLNEEGVRAVKRELVRGRGVSVSFHADDSMPGELSENVYMNPDTWSHYTYDDKGSDHVVCIVGWDDTYSSINFTEGHRPPGDGAWIVKNSWGSETDCVANERGRTIGKYNWGVRDSEGRATGYFYLSYYDKSIVDAESMEFSRNMSGNEEGRFYCMQYDYMPVWAISENSAKSALRTANIFSNYSGERLVLKSVSARTKTPYSTVLFQIYRLKDEAESPTDGELIWSGARNFEFGGFHRIDMDQELVIHAGDRFSIVETNSYLSGEGERIYEFTKGVGISKEGAEESGISYYCASVINRGESFLFEDGEWTDWKDSGYIEEASKEGFVTDNLSIKAYLTPMQGTSSGNGADTGDEKGDADVNEPDPENGTSENRTPADNAADETRVPSGNKVAHTEISGNSVSIDGMKEIEGSVLLYPTHLPFIGANYKKYLKDTDIFRISGKNAKIRSISLKMNAKGTGTAVVKKIKFDDKTVIRNPGITITIDPYRIVSANAASVINAEKWKEKNGFVGGLKAKFSDVIIGGSPINAKSRKIRKSNVRISGDNIEFSGPYTGTVPKGLFGK